MILMAARISPGSWGLQLLQDCFNGQCVVMLCRESQKSDMSSPMAFQEAHEPNAFAMKRDEARFSIVQGGELHRPSASACHQPPSEHLGPTLQII
jgi:hypothetical protein